MNQQKMCEFLKQLRKEKGMTQEEVAEKFYTSSRTISRWETGKIIPDLTTLIELAEFYGVEVSEIIDGERKSEHTEEKNKDTLKKVAAYADEDKKQAQSKLIKNLVTQFSAFILLWLVYNNIGSIGGDIVFALFSLFENLMIICGVIFFTTLWKLSFVILYNDNSKAQKQHKSITICCNILTIFAIALSCLSFLDQLNLIPIPEFIYSFLMLITFVFIFLIIITFAILIWQTIFQSPKHKKRSIISYTATLLCVFIVIIVIPFLLTYNTDPYDDSYFTHIYDYSLDSPSNIFLGLDNVLAFKGDYNATKYVVTLEDGQVLETNETYIDLSNYISPDDNYFAVSIKAVDETKHYTDSSESSYATRLTYKITFQDGDQSTVENVRLNMGNYGAIKLTLPNLTKEGYTFVGWKCETREYAPEDVVVVKADTVFVAQWVPRDPNTKYKITFVDLTGAKTTVSYESGETIQLPTDTFAAIWMCGGVQYQTRSNYVVKSDATFTAVKAEFITMLIEEGTRSYPFSVKVIPSSVEWTPPSQSSHPPCEHDCIGSGGHEFIGWMVDGVFLEIGESHPNTRDGSVFVACFSDTCTNGAPE